MKTEIIVAIIGAVAVITAAIIRVMRTKSKGGKSCERLIIQKQNSNIQGDENSIEQTIYGSDFSQSAIIKGNKNIIKQNKK